MTFALMTLATSAGAANDRCARASEDAQNLRDDGKLLQARQDFLECSNDSCPASIRKDCVESLAKLEANIPTLVFTAKDEQGHELTAVKVKADGAVIAEKLDGKAINVDPGPHTFKFEVAGSSPLEQQIVVREGEKNRSVAVSWEKNAAGVVVSGGTTQKASHVPAYIVGGLGIIGLGLGTTFAILGTDGYNTLKNGCGKTTSCTEADIAPTKTQLLVADISFGVGIVALVTAIVLFVTESSSSSSPKVGHVRVLPFTNGFGLGGSF
jgi:hypothetical protein